MPNKNKRSNSNHSKPKDSKAKRWFVGASGWGVTLNAGSGNHKTGMQKREISLPSDSRIFTLGGTIIAANFKHNTIYTYNVTGALAQGTADFNRLGDFIKIHTVGLKCYHDTFNSTTPTAPVQVRALLVASTSQVNPTAFTSGLGSTDIFYSGGSGFLTNSIVDSKRCKVLCDNIWTIAPKAAVGGTIPVHYECTLNSPFEYQTGTYTGTASNLFWVLIPTILGGSPGVTLCGQVYFDTSIAFSTL